MMKATKKNLRVLTHLEERMRESGERIDGHLALVGYELRPGERYHADRLVRLGLLKKTRSSAPWHRSPLMLYWRDESYRANTVAAAV